MQNILLWSRMTQYDNLPAVEILLKNSIASNPGNLLFIASAARTVMTDDVQLEPFFSEDVDRMLRDVQHINETYTCALIPLANAFRRDYRPKLRNLTRFIQAVRIPCYVVGVGIQARDLGEIDRGFSFDADVREFVSAVLEKSAMLGLRGEYTARYLQKLGFLPEQHFTVIGCPSAYINGEICPELRVRPFDEIHRVGINGKPGLPKHVNRLIREGIDSFEDVSFIIQNLYEFWALYFPYRLNRRTRASAPDYYPIDASNPLWKQDRVMGFLRAADWLAYMKNLDFTYGSRIHGSMAAITAGTPAISLVSDMRIRELCQYHGIPHVLAEDLHEGISLRDIYENTDFSAFKQKYAQNFAHYVDFLNKNGICHIYGGTNPVLPGEAPYDRAVAAAKPLPIIRSGMHVPLTDWLRFPEMYRMLLKYKIDNYKLRKER